MTATGWTFDTINESSFCDVAELLVYWRHEPPPHVLLAMRYLGPAKGPGKRGKAGPTEAEARGDMQQLSALMGQQARPLPPHLKQAIRDAEELKKQHRGLQGVTGNR